jgi:hypothetical protein
MMSFIKQEICSPLHQIQPFARSPLTKAKQNIEDTKDYITQFHGGNMFS